MGGGQEFRLRSGTENVASIVGFGQACEIAQNHLDENILYVKKLQTLLVETSFRSNSQKLPSMVILNFVYLTMPILLFLELMVRIS